MDPKILTSGDIKFDPERVKNKITEQEFYHVRQGMILAGGEDLRKARITYKILLVFVVICFIVWVGQIIFGVVDPEEYKKKKLPMILSIVFTAVPNTALHCYWKSFMKKTCRNIAKYFEKQNEAEFSDRGVQWGINNTLIYIKIMTLDSQVYTDI